MTTRRKRARTERVRITMHRSFEMFGDQERQRFLLDLGTLLGCTLNQIERVTFRRGCVIFDGHVPWPAAQRLRELAALHNEFPRAPEHKALDRFLESHHAAIIGIVVGKGHNISATVRRQLRRPGSDLLFIHGWRGDSESFALLPQWLEDEFRCRSLIYEYPTGLLAHSPSVVFLARDLDNWLRNEDPAESIAIIAHSYGGLVARKLLVIQEKRLDPLDEGLAQVTFFASPHHGAELARAGKVLGVLNSEQVRELSPESPVLFELNEEWQRWVELNRGDGRRIRSVFGTADPYVTPASARGLDAEAIPIAGATHEDIVRPSRRTDPVVKTLIRLLREVGFGKGGERQATHLGSANR